MQVLILQTRDTGTVTNFKVAESKMVSEAIATFAEF